MAVTRWAVILLVVWAGAANAEEQCYGPVSQLTVGTHSFFAVLAGFGANTTASLLETPSKLIQASPLDACEALGDNLRGAWSERVARFVCSGKLSL